MAHPLGEGGLADLEKRSDNISNAGEWVRFFIDSTRWVILCPWYVYAVTHGEEIYAPRRIVDQLSALERCDLLVLVGGFISPHMNYEMQSAKRLGIPVVDLTTFGISPPTLSEDNIQVVLARAQRAIGRGPRRVWVPLLTEENLEELKRARHSLYTHMPDEHNAAVALLDRIIQAAVDRGAG
jgi:hypothetical protein